MPQNYRQPPAPDCKNSAFLMFVQEKLKPVKPAKVWNFGRVVHADPNSVPQSR